MPTLKSFPREGYVGPVPSTELRQGFLDYITAMHWDGTYRDRFFHTHAFYPPTQKPSTDLKWSAKHRKGN